MRIRSDGEQKRETILEAACVVFGEKGYHKATFAEMGKRGKFNPALISFHFNSKDCLYQAVWRKMAEEVQSSWPIDGGLAPDAPAKERLRAHVQASLARHSDKRMKNFALIHMQERVNPTGLLEKERWKQETLHRAHMREAIAELLGEEATEEAVHLCEMSVINQFAILRSPRGHGIESKGTRPKQIKFTVADIEQLTDHITRFSLGGIEITRQAIAARKEDLD